MRKTIAILAAGVLIIGGAAVASAQTDEGDAPVHAREMSKGDHAAEVLAELEAAREQLQEAWADDVLTLDEIEGLPFADRLTDPEGPLADAWADGELTKDEMQEAREEFGPRRGHGRRGHGGFGPGADAPLEEGTSTSA